MSFYTSSSRTSNTVPPAPVFTIYAFATILAATFATGAFSSQVPVDLISYKARTNLSAIQVSGKAKTTPTARVEVTAAGGDQKLSQFEVEVSPNDLDSGLSLRDSHMREKIFQNADGTIPNIKFKLKDPTALKSEPTPIHAFLEIRGKVIAFEPLCSGSLSPAGATQKLKFDCKGAVSLESYSIPAPSHLGVKVLNNVEIEVATNQELKP